MSTTLIPAGWQWSSDAGVCVWGQVLMLMWFCTSPAEQNRPVTNRWLCWAVFPFADLAPATDVDASLVTAHSLLLLGPSKSQSCRGWCVDTTASTAQWSLLEQKAGPSSWQITSSFGHRCFRKQLVNKELNHQSHQSLLFWLLSHHVIRTWHPAPLPKSIASAKPPSCPSAHFEWWKAAMFIG